MKLADVIKYQLMKWIKSHSYDIIIPNYYPDGYEMDVLRIANNSNYLVEYEIKISLSDYKADFKKGTKYGYSKHEKLQYGKSLCNRFYFVCPQNIIKSVPAYAGLIYYLHENNTFQIKKAAPLLHKNIIDSKNLRVFCNKLASRLDTLDRKLRLYEMKGKVNVDYDKINDLVDLTLFEVDHA